MSTRCNTVLSRLSRWFRRNVDDRVDDWSNARLYCAALVIPAAMVVLVLSAAAGIISGPTLVSAFLLVLAGGTLTSILLALYIAISLYTHKGGLS